VELVDAYLERYYAGIERVNIVELNIPTHLIVYQIDETTEMDLYICDDRELEELLNRFRETGVLQLHKPWLNRIEEVKPIRVAVYEMKEYYRKRNLITG
jgi:hypothetical protein